MAIQRLLDPRWPRRSRRAWRRSAPDGVVRLRWRNGCRHADEGTYKIGDALPLPSTAFPRYFVPASGAVEAPGPRAGDPSWVVRILDLFRLNNREGADGDWVVGADLDGNLDLIALEDRRALASEDQVQLSHHEVANGGRIRRIDAEQLFLFAVQLLEQPDEPGLNPPIYLYGRMTGPFPRPRSAELPALNGQLTATRADVLDGLAEGEVTAFRYASSADARVSGRSFHLLLPGGPGEEIEAGRSIVLAYPMQPPEIATLDAANERLTVQILYDLLRPFSEDLARTGKPLARPVPVPNRAAYAAQLEGEGWRVTGDRAVRTSKRRSALGKMIARLFDSESMTLPPEGTTEDFFAAARLALKSLDGWPDARSQALRARLRAARAAPGATPRAEALPVQARPIPPRLQRPRRDDWMKDFIGAHVKPGGAPPRITTAATRAASSGPADWRSDFAPEPVKVPDKPREASPEWMKDFEAAPRPDKTGRKR